MRRSTAEKWAKALESGEYKQTSCALRKGDWFCAVGVLADICLDGDWVHYKKEDASFVIAENGEHLTSTAGLNDKVLKKLGISFKEHDEITDMNDSGKWSFKSLARWLRERFVTPKK